MSVAYLMRIFNSLDKLSWNQKKAYDSTESKPKTEEFIIETKMQYFKLISFIEDGKFGILELKYTAGGSIDGAAICKNFDDTTLPRIILLCRE